MNLSKNFPVADFTKSEVAERRGLNNEMAERETINARELCSAILQPVRDALGPVVVRSGYRSYEVNKAVGGKPNSQHLHGMAADIEITGMDNEKLAEWIYKNIPIWDQLILEFYTPGVPNSGWVHVSFNPDGLNRKQSLIINKSGTRGWKP